VQFVRVTLNHFRGTSIAPFWTLVTYVRGGIQCGWKRLQCDSDLLNRWAHNLFVCIATVNQLLASGLQC